MVNYKKTQIADNVHGLIYISELEQELISSAIFNRLHHVYQMSTVYMAFPTSRVRRFEHCIGTMEICGRMFYNSIANADTIELDSFFIKANNYLLKLSEIIQKIDSKTYDSFLGDNFKYIQKFQDISYQDKMFDKLVPANVSKENIRIYTILLQAIRIAGLLHDLGHPPYSHVVEKAISQLYNDKRISSKQGDESYPRIKKFYEIMIDYKSKDSQLHEQIGVNLINACFRKIYLDNNKNDNKNNCQRKSFIIFIEYLIKFILQEYIVEQSDECKLQKFLHSFISSPIDGDRLDYLVRCAKSTDFGADKIDYDRILSSMKLIEDEGNFFIGIDSKYISSIDDYLFEYNSHYNRLIYHHKCVKMDALMQQSIIDIAVDYLLDPCQKDTVIKNDTKIIPLDISGLWIPLAHSASTDYKTSSIIQWDDNWLMVMLKKYYFDNFENEDKHSIIVKLDELISNKKRYYSLIKRKIDYVPFDISLMKALESNTGWLKWVRTELKNSNNMTACDYMKKTSYEPMDNFIGSLETRMREKNSKGLSKMIYDEANEFIEINSVINETGIPLKDLFLSLMIHKNAVSQIDSSIRFYDKTKKNKKFAEISTMDKLLFENDINKGFFVYYLPGNDFNNSFEFTETITKILINALDKKLEYFNIDKNRFLKNKKQNYKKN